MAPRRRLRTPRLAHRQEGARPRRFRCCDCRARLDACLTSPPRVPRSSSQVVVHADLTSLRQHFEPSALLLEYGGEAAVLGAMQSEGVEEASGMHSSM